MAKIFIGVVTYAHSEQYLPLWLAHVAAQTEHDWSIHFIDTTVCTGYAREPYAPRLREHLATHVQNNLWTVDEEHVFRAPTEAKFAFLARARNQLREQFLNSDADYLFFIDDDVLIPPHALRALLSDFLSTAAHAVSGVYLTPLLLRSDQDATGKAQVAPVVVVRDQDLPADCARPLKISCLLEPQIMPVLAAGFGCVLIARTVLQHIPIQFSNASMTEDFPFYLEMERLGYVLFLDTRVLCSHLKYPLGDDRNKLLVPEHYRT